MTDVSAGDRVFVHIEKPGTVTGVYTCCGEETVVVHLDGDDHALKLAASYVTRIPAPEVRPVGEVRQSPEGDYVILREPDPSWEDDPQVWEGSHDFYTDSEVATWPILFTPTPRYRYFRGITGLVVYRVPVDATPGTEAEYRASEDAPWCATGAETLSSLLHRVAVAGWKEMASA